MSAVVVVTVGIVGYAEYRRLVGNITSVNVGGLTDRGVEGVQNILILGSQERQGQRGGTRYFGYEQNPWTSNSDNLLLIHLNAAHTRATVLSIPRDLYAYEPGCRARIPQIGYGIQGPYNYPPGSLIDGALNIGGPTCAVETVEDLTGIKLDHVVEFDFNSFRTMVDAMGGVEVCVPPGRGYHDRDSHVNLSPGLHRVTYDTALAYVRTRHDLGGADAGGDLPRIELQQAFISSVAQQVQKEGLLSNLSGLLKLAGIATKALTVDKGLDSVRALLSLGRSLAHMQARDISLITLPTTTDTFDYPQYDQHLMAVQPQDDVLYQMVRTGQQWKGHLPTQPDRKVEVQVLNATGQAGLAARTATSLRKLGFDVTGIGDAAYTATTTVSFAGLDQADDAYTLMTALHSFPAGNNTLAEPAWQVGQPGPVTLILGADFAGVNPPDPSAKHGKASTGGGSGGTATVSQAGQNGPGAVQSRNGGANICSGLPPAG